WLRAASGFTLVGRDRMPSRYGAAATTDDGALEAFCWAGAKAGPPIDNAATARTRTRPAMTTRSIRFIEWLRGGRRSAPPAPRRGPAGSDVLEEVRPDGERDEQDQQEDRELPQPSFDAAPAPIDRRIATERARQAGSPGLEQDRGDEGDADDDLADGQGCIHEGCPPVGTATDDSTGPGSGPARGTSSEVPVIPSQRGSPASSSRVGATSARTPSRRVRPSIARPASRNGTGLSECAVTGFPSAVRIESALPWSAVIARRLPGPSGSAASRTARASTIRARQASIVSTARTAASQTPV